MDTCRILDTVAHLEPQSRTSLESLCGQKEWRAGSRGPWWESGKVAGERCVCFPVYREMFLLTASPAGSLVAYVPCFGLSPTCRGHVCSPFLAVSRPGIGDETAPK